MREASFAALLPMVPISAPYSSTRDGNCQSIWLANSAATGAATVLDLAGAALSAATLSVAAALLVSLGLLQAAMAIRRKSWH